MAEEEEEGGGGAAGGRIGADVVAGGDRTAEGECRGGLGLRVVASGAKFTDIVKRQQQCKYVTHRFSASPAATSARMFWLNLLLT